MPCFKGLAVSIHANDGPLPEHSIQKQARFSRITSYIPVPPPKITGSSSTLRPEPSTFSISITLLTPGLSVPYSMPKPTIDNPTPRGQVVGGLPGVTDERGRYSSSVEPYSPMTSSPNETIAAYIYFDGRQKEEVATLLRRGEETWVNSRWVSVPESEGGGLAERDFLFREVGLERWLNGLDLDGSKDAAAKIEKRRQKMERKRQKKRTPSGSDDDGALLFRRRSAADKGVLRYGSDDKAPLEKLSDDSDILSSDESDDDPVPEATGQIKVALFRVLASGEIKKGEYSPQFDAHDDDEATPNGQAKEATNEADIDHTTSFAKPKPLDPQSISTQTVTGIDGPEKPYAVFTFLYRGEKQLQKMGILKPYKESPTMPKGPVSKRRSDRTDFGTLNPLRAGGALGFTGIRDSAAPPAKDQQHGDDGMDSDDEPEAKPLEATVEDEDPRSHMLSPEEAKQQGEIADGVKKIKLKRQHSFEPSTASTTVSARRSSISTTPPSGTLEEGSQLLPSAIYEPSASTSVPDTSIGSPLKKQRASIPAGQHPEVSSATATSIAGGLGFAFTAGNHLEVGPALKSAARNGIAATEDEEL